MADKSFGVKEIELIGASGTPTIESPNNLEIKAVNVAISTDITVGGMVSLGAGTSISSPGTNELTFGTNSTEKVRIDSAGNMGLGTNNPNDQTSSGYTSFTVNDSSGGIIDLRRGDIALSGGRLVGLQHEFGLEARSQNSSSQISFYVNNAYTGRWTVDGLCFGSDTAAANALDDYEEGTWTPAIGNTGYSYTYSVQEGQYTKIGRLVTLRFRIVVTARSGSSSGGHPIINLPITSDGTMDGSSYAYAMPSELIVHKTSTTTTSGAKTLLFGGVSHSNTSNFWVNNPTTSQTTPFDLGSDFNLGGVITYTA